MKNRNWRITQESQVHGKSFEVGIVLFFALCMSVQVQADLKLGLEPGDLRLCNDDIGVILWGPDNAVTLSVGKSDVWDRRLPKESVPILTVQQMMDMAMVGDKRILNGADYYKSYNHYDFPCPKPVGQLILLMPFVEPGGKVEVEHSTYAYKITGKNGKKKVKLKIFVSAQRNLILLYGTGENLVAGDLAIRLYRHRDTIVPGGELHPTIAGKNSPTDFERLPLPRAGAEKDSFWIAQDFPADLTFPDGFVSVLAARVEGVETEFETELGKTGLGTPMIAEKEGRLSHGITKRFTPINEAPGSAVTAKLRKINGPFSIYATVVTTQDYSDPFVASQGLLKDAVQTGTEPLWQEHAERLERYEMGTRAIAWVDVIRGAAYDQDLVVDEIWGGNPYRLRPGGYFGDIPFCSVDSTKYCYQDSSRWHADFHFNEVSAIRSCILRQFDSMDPYLRLMQTMMPMCQANAREVYGCSGVMYPLVHYPMKAETVIHTHITWEQSMEITAMLLKPFWLRFQYTWDMDFLRDMAYPIMREGARFYADFLKKEDDGLYHVFPTVSPEHRGITEKLKYNHDSQSGITLIRYHLRATAEAARLLGCDEGEAARWSEIAENMPAYPTVQTPEGPIFIDVAGAEPREYNIAVPLTAVFWGDDIGLDSPPELLEIMHRTLRLINVWEPHRFYLHRVKTRLGIYDESSPLDVENFLQSHTGVIRVFPAVPSDYAGGFSDFGAQGGFVISSRRKQDGVEFIRVQSLAGNDCSVANPWPDREVEVICELDGKKVSATVEPKTIRFKTQCDGFYHLRAK